MKHGWLVTVVAVGIFVLGVLGVLLFEPGTLAKRTITLGDATIVFRIKESDGGLYASATEKRWWGGGQRTLLRIGETSEVGNANPRITVDERTERVVLEVGRVSAPFDAASHSFRVAAAGP